MNRAVADTGPRLEVVHGRVPLVAAALRVDNRDRAGRHTVFRRERRFVHFDRAHRVDRQFDGVVARHRIGAVRIVELECTLIAAGAADVEQTVRSAHDAGNERQRVLEAVGRDGCDLQFRGA